MKQKGKIQSSVNNLNYKIILLQQDRIQALRVECERLERECQDLNSLRNEYGLLYDQAERLIAELRRMAKKAKEMAEETDELRQEILPEHSYGQKLITFLDDLHRQFTYFGRFF